MNKKTLKKRSISKRSAKRFFYFRLAGAALVVGVFAVFGLIGKNSLAQSWSEPTGAPPSNNVSAPIWNQTSSAQAGSFYVSGKGRFDTTGTGDAYCTSGKVCGVDAASSGGSNGVVGESNTGYGVYASSTSNYGLYASSGTTYAGYFLGNVYVNGTMNAVNGLQVNGTNVCLSNGTNCQASGGGYWTANGNNIYNNNTASVGIGTNSPNYKLDVRGTIMSGNDLVGGAGTLRLGNGGAGAFTIVGSDTTGNVVVNNANTIGGSIDLQSRGASALFIQSGGNRNVGVGTANPGAQLDIVGPANGNGINLRTLGDVMVGTATGASIFFDGNYSYAGGSYIKAAAANTQAFFTSGAERVRIDPSGNVGIGTSTPTNGLLDVEIASGTGIYGSGSTYGVYGKNGSSGATASGVYGYSTVTSGNGMGVYGMSESTTGIGVFGQAHATTGKNYGVYGESDSPTGYGVYTDNKMSAGQYCISGANCISSWPSGGSGFWTANGNDIYNNNTGKVGIGTTTPDSKLQVAGLIDFDAKSNTFLGKAVGGGSSQTGFSNVGVGASALYSLLSGGQNTAIGYEALEGSNASYNTAVGYDALWGANTGGNNVAVGAGAGTNLVVPYLSTVSNSTFVGYGTGSSIDGITNSMALGNGAQVTASNQVVIGNTSVTATKINGALNTTGAITQNGTAVCLSNGTNCQSGGASASLYTYGYNQAGFAAAACPTGWTEAGNSLTAGTVMGSQASTRSCYNTSKACSTLYTYGYNSAGFAAAACPTGWTEAGYSLTAGTVNGNQASTRSCYKCN